MAYAFLVSCCCGFVGFIQIAWQPCDHASNGGISVVFNNDTFAAHLQAESASNIQEAILQPAILMVSLIISIIARYS
jgi:hypothetical protein